ncbi:hypothetical protein FISHEDRAFT_28903, partial [Fistulina hepatica ATCC 64428]
KDPNWIAPSPLRPACPTAERIFRWKSLASLNLDESLRTESPALQAGYWLSLTSSFTEPTRSSYGAGLLRFHQFCDQNNVSESRRMPIHVTLLASFLGCWSSRVSGSTIKNWLSGLKAWHDINLQPWLGDHTLIRLARCLAAREGRLHHCPIRQPVTCELLLLLRRGLDIFSPKGAAIWACA